MALLQSEKKRLGTPAPDFDLKSVEGKSYRLSDFADKKVLVVMFLCNHCPYVRAIEDRIIRLQRDYAAKSVQLVGICANDPTDYPEDSPENLQKQWQKKDYRFPYLIDESQDVARSFGAVCTPDLYVFDEKRRLAYHGQLDNHWKEPQNVTRRDLSEAIDALLAGKNPAADQIPSMGCSIKWKRVP